jgi:ornithine cyclodeaminase
MPDWGVAGGKDYTSLAFETPAMWATIVDTRTGLPVAFVEADYLSRARTAATTAVATDLLAPRDVRCLAHFGAGKISKLLVQAMIRIRPSIRRVFLVRRDAVKGAPDWLHQLPQRVQGIVTDPETAVGEADLVTTATSSRTPIIPADASIPKLRHINLIGSNHIKRCEISEQFARRCIPPEGYLVADDPLQASLEAGDFATLARAGVLDWKTVPSLGQVLESSLEKEKASKASFTAFKSVGIGLVDLAIAAGIMRRLRLLGT